MKQHNRSYYGHPAACTCVRCSEMRLEDNRRIANQPPNRTHQTPRRRATRRSRRGWWFVAALAAIAIAVVVWPVESYGEGALWDVKLEVDSNIRNPITEALARSAEPSPTAQGADGGSGGQLVFIPTATPLTAGLVAWERGLKDTGEYSGVRLQGELLDEEAFYDLLSKCGGAIEIRNQIMEAMIAPGLPELAGELKRDQWTDVAVGIERDEYGTRLRTKGKVLVFGNRVTMNEATELMLTLRQKLVSTPPAQKAELVVRWAIEQETPGLGDGWKGSKWSGYINKDCAVEVL